MFVAGVGTTTTDTFSGWGHSLVASPWGNVIAQVDIDAEPRAEATVLCEIDLDYEDEVRCGSQFDLGVAMGVSPWLQL